MRKHLRGPGQARMISTAFDPAFLSTRKGVARRSNLAITCQSFIRSCHKAHAVLWHLLSLCGERRQRRRIICRFSYHTNRGCGPPGVWVVIKYHRFVNRPPSRGSGPLSGYSFVGPENQPSVPNAGDCLPLRLSRPEAHTCHLCCI